MLRAHTYSREASTLNGGSRRALFIQSHVSIDHYSSAVALLCIPDTRSSFKLNLNGFLDPKVISFYIHLVTSCVLLPFLTETFSQCFRDVATLKVRTVIINEWSFKSEYSCELPEQFDNVKYRCSKNKSHHVFNKILFLGNIALLDVNNVFAVYVVCFLIPTSIFYGLDLFNLR